MGAFSPPPPDGLADAAGLVLAGGRSRRYGAEKAVALFSGRLLLVAAIDALRDCAMVAVSARPRSAAAAHAERFGLKLLHDAPDHPEGPLAGVAAGLAWAEANACAFLAVAPCDTPLLPASLYTRLRGEIGEAPAAFAASDGGPHPLCSLWSVQLRAPLSAALAAGAHPAARDFLAAHDARQVWFDDDGAFANVNRQSDLARLEGRA